MTEVGEEAEETWADERRGTEADERRGAEAEEVEGRMETRSRR